MWVKMACDPVCTSLGGFLLRQQFFVVSAAVFFLFRQLFFISRQQFWAHVVFVFYLPATSFVLVRKLFVLLSTHGRSFLNCRTGQLFCSFFLFRQQFFAGSEVLFYSFGSIFLLLQLFSVSSASCCFSFSLHIHRKGVFKT